MSNNNALWLLVDHIKLLLLERRAKKLDLESDCDTQDGHISRSLEQLKDGLETLEREQMRLGESGDEEAELLVDSLLDLKKQHSDLAAQFHDFTSTPRTTASSTFTTEEASLAQKFAPNSPTTTKTTTNLHKKSVRFSLPSTILEPQNQQSYRDNPSDATENYRDQISDHQVSNVQVHAYHQRVLEEQDAQLDALGDSIERQRTLSMQIGDELDDQVMLLDETEGLVDWHQTRVDQARRRVGRIARKASENRQIMAIFGLIVILVLLIITLK